MSVANAQAKRFQLSLTLDRWQRLGAELTAMEHVPHAGWVSVEKQIERDRASEQIQAIVAAVLAEHRDASEAQLVERSLPLGRAAAKYLLTACDRLRRAALGTAWTARSQQAEAAAAVAASNEALSWDRLMRALSLQHGVVHPLPEMVTPLTLGDNDLAQLGTPVDALLNGHDLLAQ